MWQWVIVLKNFRVIVSKLLLYWAVSGEASYRKMSQNFEAAKFLCDIYLEAAHKLGKNCAKFKRITMLIFLKTLRNFLIQGHVMVTVTTIYHNKTCIAEDFDIYSVTWQLHSVSKLKRNNTARCFNPPTHTHPHTHTPTHTHTPHYYNSLHDTISVYTLHDKHSVFSVEGVVHTYHTTSYGSWVVHTDLPYENYTIIKCSFKHTIFQGDVTDTNPWLINLPLVPHICVSESGQHWFRQWLVACSAPSYYLNQCWAIVNWTLGNKLQWNFNQNTKIFLHENASENIVCETAAILSGGDELKMNCSLYVFSTVLVSGPHY